VFNKKSFVKSLLLSLVILAAFVAGQFSSIVPASASVTTTADWSVESNQASAEAGRAVGFAGDVNGDGHLDVFVGMPFYDNGQTNEGRVAVYYGSADGLSTTADWTAESDKIGALFGATVARAGDVNGDGFDDLIVGAPYWDEDTDIKIGKVFVYHGSSGGLTTASWTMLGENDDDRFGGSVATAGDVDGDDYDEVLVGSQRHDNGQTDEGKVYAFHGSSGGLSGSPDWTYESNQIEALLGTSVSSAGDVNNDGYDDVIIGSYEYGNNAQGRVYVYYGSSGGLSSSASWTKDGQGWFGFSVSYAGDLNSDGYGDIIVGEPKTDVSPYSQAGKAHIFVGSNTGLDSTAYWTKEGTSNGENYGFAVASAGAILDNTIFRVIVGAPGYDGGQTDEGAAFIYYARCD
jgi:hypothetical protein